MCASISRKSAFDPNGRFVTVLRLSQCSASDREYVVVLVHWLSLISKHCYLLAQIGLSSIDRAEKVSLAAFRNPVGVPSFSNIQVLAASLNVASSRIVNEGFERTGEFLQDQGHDDLMGVDGSVRAKVPKLLLTDAQKTMIRNFNLSLPQMERVTVCELIILPPNKRTTTKKFPGAY